MAWWPHCDIHLRGLRPLTDYIYIYNIREYPLRGWSSSDKSSDDPHKYLIRSYETRRCVIRSCLWFCYIYSIGESKFMQSDSVNSVDSVDLINDQFNEYQSLLSLKEKKLKILVDLDNDNECNELISLLGEIKDKDIVL